MIDSYWCRIDNNADGDAYIGLMLNYTEYYQRGGALPRVSIQVGAPGKAKYEDSNTFINPVLNMTVPNFGPNNIRKADAWLTKQLKNIEAWVRKNPGEKLT